MALINLNLTFSEANAIIKNSKNKSLTEAIFNGTHDKFKEEISKLVGSLVIDLSDEEVPIHVIKSYDKNDDSCQIRRHYDIRWFNNNQLTNFIYDLNERNALIVKDGKYEIAWNDSIVELACNSNSSFSYSKSNDHYPLLVPKTVNTYKSDFLFSRNEGSIIITADAESDAVKKAEDITARFLKKGDDLFQSIAQGLFPMIENVVVETTSSKEEERNSESENKGSDDSLSDDIVNEQPF